MGEKNLWGFRIGYEFFKNFLELLVDQTLCDDALPHVSVDDSIQIKVFSFNQY
jgi:hypothetical protein